MSERVFFAWLSIITLVASTPVPQVYPTQQYASQQTPFKTSASISAPYQAAASQTNPYIQQSMVQNQAPVHNSDGTMMNELLMTKILKNPCLQKILDPETKLYNQNGREIQRQPNTGATPSVINNYFIVPPEFFNLNTNKTEAKVPIVPRRRKVSNRKANLTKAKAKANVLEDKENIITSNVTSISDMKSEGQNKNREKKKKQSRKPAKMIENITETNLEHDTKEPKPEEKKTKKRKKQEFSEAEKEIETSLHSDDSKVGVYDPEVNRLPVQNTISKRRKKTRTELHAAKNETGDNILTSEIINGSENVLPKIKKTNSVTNDKKTEVLSEKEDESRLKNIEFLVDNKETKNLQENSRPTKHVKENRKNRYPNDDKVKNKHKETSKQAHTITPISDDILKNFNPYMYMGKNFYSNGNYPFNFEQFYQSHIGRTDEKHKNGKGRTIQNKQNKKDSLPNIVKQKLKPKKQQNATAAKPMNKEITDEPKRKFMNLTTTVKPLDEKYKDKLNIDSMNIITSTESVESNTVTPIKKIKDEKELEILKADAEIKPDSEPPSEKQLKVLKVGAEIKPDSAPSSEMQLQVLKKEVEMNPDPEPLKEKSVAIKSNLENSPTVIEDLHEYITPELGSEDIVPTVQTNGIINDYYPVFHDDSYYANDENYYLRDLEDDRHFYSTSRGFEDPLNRERRMYDRYEDFPRANLDIKDRINFRRTYKLQEREKTKIKNDDTSYIRRTYPENFFEKEIAELNNNVEDQFQTPPLLENPDFMTTKIEKVYTKSDVDSFGQQNPIYTGSAEKVTEHNTFPGPKPIQYGRLMNFDGDVKNDKISGNKPRSDRIETVYAKTRVVKYGVAKDEEENTSSLPLFDNDVDEFHSDGHTTYVLAKSLGHSDDYFW